MIPLKFLFTAHGIERCCVCRVQRFSIKEMSFENIKETATKRRLVLHVEGSFIQCSPHNNVRKVKLRFFPPALDLCVEAVREKSISNRSPEKLLS